MATMFGFRIYKLTLYKERGRRPMDFDKAYLGNVPSRDNESSSFAASLSEVCEGLRGRPFTQRLTYKDRSPGSMQDDSETEEADQPEEDRTDPYIRLESWQQCGRRFDIVFRSGRTGSHDQANGETAAEDVYIKRKAPSNEFHAQLYLPMTGPHAALVVEARGRFCPGPELAQLIGVGSKILDEERPVPERIGWWRLSTKQLTDPTLMERYLRDGTAVGLRFTRTALSPDGGGRRRNDLVLTRSGLPAGVARQAKAMMLGWVRSSMEGQAPDKDQVVEEATELLEIEIRPSDFEEAEMEWEYPDGTRKFLSPDQFNDKFTYRPWSRGHRPSNIELLYESKKRLLDVTKIYKMSLDL